MKRHRLQDRIAWRISLAVLVSFLAAAVVLLAHRHSLMMRSMEAAARTYTALVALPVVETAAVYRSTGRHILEKRVQRWRQLNEDLVVLEVVNVDGAVIMSSTPSELRSFADEATQPVVEDQNLLLRVRGLEPSSDRVRSPGGARSYRVVAPAVEEWGRHTYSVVATFSYAQVNRELATTTWVLGLVLAVVLVLAWRISVGLAGTITHRVELLHAGVQRLQEGFLDERVRLDSQDEIADLADAFNDMADNLLRTIESLRAANRELERLDQTKADLVANVSHELKTPLTALRGYLELLEQGSLGPLSEGAQQAVDVCQKNVRRLGLRIEDLVQLSDLDRSFASDLVVEQVHLGKLLNDVMETLLVKLEEKGVLCSLNLATDLPPVLGNTEQLERVFINLLDNARKFTPHGGHIRVSAEPYPRDDIDGVVVRVADTGVGVPPGEMLRIFDRFYQVDTSARRKQGGMGLGLSLVRSIVESHRGAVWVESKEGRGATFFVWLPKSPLPGSGVHRAVRARDSSDTLDLGSLAKRGEGSR